MPWKECSKEDERVEFVSLAKVEGANVRRLCERFGISRKTGHKWLRRFGSNESLTDPIAASATFANTYGQKNGASSLRSTRSAPGLGRAEDRRTSPKHWSSRSAGSEHDYGDPSASRAIR
jgi:transposase-like protein